MYATIFFKCDYYNDGSGRVYGHDYDDWFNGADKPAFRKFMPADMAGLETNYCAINVPLMRYSNVLLMKALRFVVFLFMETNGKGFDWFFGMLLGNRRDERRVVSPA